ncbi:MAG: LLM class flavin-dependent oxidoreductase [Thaumarchaeota archaeon]|nr:LLM class flavin-dependent oxidoreductase [Candidatus Calditenuaceae archaeon]MDW8186486.1 LLM class flavin-dependent oxidoreductase [Nitrososphaerota archaeon]
MTSSRERARTGERSRERRRSLGIALEGDRSHHELTRLALLAEKLKLDSVHLYEHLPYRSAWASAFLIARETSCVKVGPVTVPALAYEPLMLARLAASLREVAGERALLGISRGAFGELIGRTRPKVDEFAAYLRRVHSLLEEERLSLTQSWSKRELPKIYVGTSGTKVSAMAAKMPFVSGVVVDNLWDSGYARILSSNVREARKEVSLNPEDFELIARPFCYVCDDRRAALSALQPILRGYVAQLIGDSPMLRYAGLDTNSLKEALQGPPAQVEDVISRFAFFGTVEELEAQLEELFDSGVTQVVLGYPLGPDPEDAIRSIARAALTLNRP